MALIEPFMVKAEFGLSADESVELEAKSGESLLVKDVIVYDGNDEYVVLEVDKTTVGFFRVDAHPLGSHLYPTKGRVRDMPTIRGVLMGGSITLLSYMIKKGWMRGYPVAEGQTFRVKPFTTGKTLKNVAIVYEKYDAGDIKSTDENGSEAKVYTFVNYGRPANDISTAADIEINTCVTTEEFPDFPFGKSVPSKTTIEILAILGTEVINYSDASNYIYTKYLKMFRGRTCLFDKDKRGLPFYQTIYSGIASGVSFARGFSLVGNYSAYDRREPFVPPTPLTFKEGAEVKVFVTTGLTGSGVSIEKKYAEIAFVERVTVEE